VLLFIGAQFLDVPGSASLLLNRTYSDLALPGALMDIAGDWFRGSPLQWHDKTKSWTSPEGGALTFGFLKSEADKYRYRGSSYQTIGFDELTRFTRSQFLYVSRRSLRRPRSGPVSKLPLRIRNASNPGDIGHDWARDRYVDPGDPSRPFVPAKIPDNIYLDRDDYMESLRELDPITRAHLLAGDWDAREKGDMFDRAWFRIVSDRLPDDEIAGRVRFWDFAATTEDENDDPDWSVGLLLAVTRDGVYYVEHVVRGRWSPGELERVVQQTARLDGPLVPIRAEQEPGASGKQVRDHYRDVVLGGFDFNAKPSTGSKLARARPVSGLAEARKIRLVRGVWNTAFLDELEPFPKPAPHDDQVDGLSGAHWWLARLAGGQAW